MSNFKHSLNLKWTNRSTAIKMTEDLIKLGYKSYFALPARSGFYLCVNQAERPVSIRNGAYDFFAFPHKREYEFNIENEWEYKAALAIAAIRDDYAPHVGEWVVSSTPYCILGPEGSLHKICQVSGAEFGNSFNVEGVIPDTCSWTTSLHFNPKATPEQIIEWFKSQQLPKKWAFKVENIEMSAWLSKNWNHPSMGLEGYFLIGRYYLSEPSSIGHWSTYSAPKGYELITFEQIKNFINMNKGKNIIGYKAPHDLFNGNIKCGEVYEIGNVEGCYYPSGRGLSSWGALPKEIVEKWEPVYEEEKIYFGIYETKFHKAYIKVGYKEISRNTIMQMADLLGDGEAQATMTIQGEPVTEELLNKILKRMDKCTD